MAGITDIKAKPSPPAELIIGLTLVSHGKMSLDTQYNKDWMLYNCQINLRKVEASHGESRGVIGEHGEARVVEEMHILQSVSQ